MTEFVFNKGIDYWNANYYPNLGYCFLGPELANSFGYYFAGKMNQSPNLQNLCDVIYETIKNNQDHFSNINTKDLEKYCFEDGGVTYREKQQYIRFPNFTNRNLKNYLIRMNINPCIGRHGAMTKMYCIPRFTDEISLDKIGDFIAGARIISENALDCLTDIYIDIYNQFAEEREETLDKIEVSEESKKKIKVTSLCLGSESKDADEFLYNANRPRAWRKYTKNNKTANNFLKALKILNNSSSSEWELSDYDWYLHNVVIYDESMPDASSSKEISGYLGYAKDDNQQQYLGIANSTPRDLLLPIHLNLIRTDLHHFDGKASQR